MPLDGQAIQESALLGENAADTRAAIAARYAAAQNNLGFGTGVGNPYSKSAENQRTFAASSRAVPNTAGAQLYSGSTLNAMSEARARYDRNQKAIEAAEGEEENAFNTGNAETAREEALGKTSIAENAIDRAAKSEPALLAVPGSRRAKRTGRGRGLRAGRNVNARGRGRL